MLKLTAIDVLLRTIPEAFLFIISAYLISCKKINKRHCVISILLMSVFIYLIRELPIHYGVHIIINIVIYALVMVFINKMDAIEAITYSLGFMMILAICEWINLFMLNMLIGNNLQSILEDPLTKNLYFSPSLILFIISVFLIRTIMKKRNVCV